MGGRLVLATGNAGKLREIRALLEPLALEVVPQTELGVTPAEETGASFVENALLKARQAARLTGLPALADDSGLAVDALGGAPGIHSACFAGPGATDQDNNRKLLEQLAGVPETRRTARYHCVIVLLRHAADPVPLICHGRWEGRILNAPHGTGGFGYDPLFLPAGLDRTAAELPAAEKNRLSHRGQALETLLAALRGSTISP